MITTSAEYKTAIAQNKRQQVKLKALISGVEVTGKYLINATVEEMLNSADAITMGATCSSKLTLNMRMPSPAVALNGAEIKLYSGLVIDGDTVEWVPLGVFYVDPADIATKTDYLTVTVIAYDGMSKLGNTYVPGITEWPATIQAVAQDICAQVGLPLDDTIVWPDYTISSGTFDAAYTCREMIGFIAGMMGCNARFDRLGKLTFTWYVKPLRTVYGESSQTVTEQGKNLFDNNKAPTALFAATVTPISTGFRVAATSIGTYRRGRWAMQLKPNTAYRLSYVKTSIEGSGEGGSWVSEDGVDLSGKYNELDGARFRAFTTRDSGAVEINFAANGSISEKATADFTNIQLEEGTTVTFYEPFVPNSPSPDYPSPISKVSSVKVSGIDYPAPQDLYSLPDGTRDWYDFLTGEGESPIGINVFNGTETIVADTEGTNTYCFYAELPNGAGWGASPAYCSHFKRLGGVDVDEEGFTGDTSNKVYFRVKKQRLAGDTANDFKNFLAAQDTAEMPVTVIYKKATSTAITGTPQFIPTTDSVLTITRGLQYQNGLEKTTVDNVVITALTTGMADNVITAGAGRGLSFANPFITQDIANTLLERITGFTYTPVQLKWRGNPAVEVGDIVAVEDKTGSCIVPVTGQKIVLTGGLYTEITAAALPEVETVMPATPTETKLQRMYAGLAAALQAATKKLTGTAGGYFHIETDESGHPTGWIISDTPTITPYTKLWRFNSAGLAWSGNGGATYSNIAITMDGQISANAVTVGTMSAERIAVEKYGESGEQTLESYIHFGDGSITLGKSGNELALKIENDKISFIAGLGTSGEKTVAYFSNNSLQIVDVARVRFGNFSFVPRPNGNLTFTKVVS